MTEAVELFQSRLERNELVVGIIGLGYVGLPLAKAFWNARLRVIGFDIDDEKVKTLNAGGNYLKHLGEEFVREMVSDGRFSATADMLQMAQADALIICVPTPLGKHLDPDLSFVGKTTDQIAQTLHVGQLIVLESTTYPMTTREVVLPRLEANGFKCGRDFFLAFSPEREDPGRKDFNTQNIPKLVGGIDRISGEIAAALYSQAIEKVILVSSAEVAEAAKILENVYRSVNIALVNEMKVILAKMDIDIWEVIEAAKTKPFGFQPFYPGPGLGGHCIPIDPYYLTWKAREAGLTTRFIELAGEVNHLMPRYVIERISGALNDHRKSVHGSKILVLGLAYKPNVDDVRESPSFEIIHQLRALGAQVSYSDPHVPQTHEMRRYPDNPPMQSVTLSAATLKEFDCVVIATDHAAFDWQFIADHSKLIIDTRNAMAKVSGPRKHIVKA